MTEKCFEYTIDSRLIRNNRSAADTVRAFAADVFAWIGVCDMNSLRERMTRFMYGRYGSDQLSKLYLGLAMAFLILNLLTRLGIFYLAGMAFLFYGMYRSFSKNIAKMSAQNQKYLTWRYQKTVKYSNAKKHWAQRREYRFFSCPGCRQKVRVDRKSVV